MPFLIMQIGPLPPHQASEMVLCMVWAEKQSLLGKIASQRSAVRQALLGRAAGAGLWGPPWASSSKKEPLTCPDLEGCVGRLCVDTGAVRGPGEGQT